MTQYNVQLQDGNVTIVPCADGNRDYAEYLESGTTADAYVAPPAPTLLTAAENLTNAGLTVEEL